MTNWTKFSTEWPPYDIPIHIRRDNGDGTYVGIPERVFTLRHLPKKAPLSCENKFELVIKGKKKLIGAFPGIFIESEWRKYE